MEILDVYDDLGNPTARKVVRGNKKEIFNKNEHIAIAIIFIENSNEEFLIQKTSQSKGGKYSSTGGHVDSGEKPLESIKRETKEEIGVNIDNDKIIFLGMVQIGMPLRFLFYVKKDVNINEVKVQKEEVESISYMSINQIKSIINNNMMLESHAILFEKMLECRNKNNI